ncbi:MAG: hypothetical protein AAGD10_00895 [Myxococcota bacterium]
MVGRLSFGIFALALCCSEGVEPFESVGVPEPPPEQPTGFPEGTALIDVSSASRSLLLLVQSTELIRFDLDAGTVRVLSERIHWQGSLRRRAKFVAGGDAVLFRARDDVESPSPLEVHYADGEVLTLSRFTGVFFEDAPRPLRLAAFTGATEVTVVNLLARSQRRFDAPWDRVDVFETEQLRRSEIGRAETIRFIDRPFVAPLAFGAGVVLPQGGYEPLPEFNAADFAGRPPLPQEEAFCGVSAAGSLLRLDLQSLQVEELAGDFIAPAVAQGPLCLGLSDAPEGLQLTALGPNGHEAFIIPDRTEAECRFSGSRSGAVLIEACDLAIVDGRPFEWPFAGLFLGPPEQPLVREDVTGQFGPWAGIFLGQVDDKVGLSVWRASASGPELDRRDFPKVIGPCGFELVPTVEPKFILSQDEQGRLGQFGRRTIFLTEGGRYLRCVSSADVDGAELWLGEALRVRERRLTDVPVQTDLNGFAFSDRVLFHPDMTVVLDEEGAEPGRLRLRVFDHPRD